MPVSKKGQQIAMTAAPLSTPTTAASKTEQKSNRKVMDINIKATRLTTLKEQQQQQQQQQ